MTKSDFLLSGDAMVSCNVLSCCPALKFFFFFFAGYQILSDSDLQIKKKETEATINYGELHCDAVES